MVWGYERVADYLDASLSEKLKYVPKEDIITPKLTLAGPAIEAMRFAADDEILRELFTNLLASAMNRHTAQSAHTAYVEVIKQLEPDEAKILSFICGSNLQMLPLITIRKKGITPEQGSFAVYMNFTNLGYLAECENPSNIRQYIDNLIRLRILEIPHGRYLLTDSLYEELRQLSEFKHIISKIRLSGFELEESLGYLTITNFGEQFARVCLAFGK